MSNYTARLIITIPADLLSTGRAIARAFDPDVRGTTATPKQTMAGWLTYHAATISI